MKGNNNKSDKYPLSDRPPIEDMVELSATHKPKEVEQFENRHEVEVFDWTTTTDGNILAIIRRGKVKVDLVIPTEVFYI
jgi:uncharacterized protein YacL